MIFKKKKYNPVNNLIDQLEDHLEFERRIMNYYWRRFEKLVEISYHLDKRTTEYKKINKMAWTCLERWWKLFGKGCTEKE